MEIKFAITKMKYWVQANMELFIEVYTTKTKK